MQHRGPSRRRAGGRLISFVALLAALGLVAAACGGSDSSSDDSSDAAAEADPTGVVRQPYNIASLGGVKFDPTASASPADFVITRMVYDSLLRFTPDGGYDNGLASDVKVVDPSTIDVTLVTGVKFSDGSAVDAAAVKASIERNQKASVSGTTATTFRTEIQQIDSITVTTPTAFRIKLKTPIAGAFFPLLAGIETAVVAPSAIAANNINAKPIGAGPFVLDNYTIDQKITLKKNASYFQADTIKVSGLEYIQADDVSRVTAFRSNQVDATALNAGDVPSIQNTSPYEVLIRPSDTSSLWFQLCKNKPPFNDLRVRQALMYGIDRKLLNTGVLADLGAAQNGLWPEGNRLYSKKAAEQYPYNATRAKELLAQAGYTASNPLKFDLGVVANFTASERAGEVVQQQLKAIGVEVTVQRSTNIVEDFFVSARYPIMTVPFTRNGTDKISRTLQSGSIGNVCNYNNPELNGVVDKLKATDQQSEEAVALWDQAQQIIGSDAAVIYGVWNPQIHAYNESRLAGVRYVPDIFGNLTFDGYTAYVKKSS